MTLQDNSTLGEINRNYWNDKTETVWSEEWVKTLTRQITTHLQTHKQWIGITSSRPGEPIRLLDYACGNGAASSALSPDVAMIRGIDVSEDMVDRFNEAARMQGFSAQKFQALQGDLLAPGDRISESLMGPDMFEFDVAVMSMALHHVQDPLQMMKKLVERLRIGGSLLIIDWATEPNRKSTGLHHGHHHWESGEHLDLAKIHETMAQASFDKDEMIHLFRNAGCSDVKFELHPEVSVLPEKFGGEKQLFFARGTKS